MSLKVIRQGTSGEAVRKWQQFLIGEKMLNDAADGIFGPATDRATKKYQKSVGLTADGVVGSKTYARAIGDGMAVVEDENEYPPHSDFYPLMGTSARQRVFGKFDYEAAPTSRNKERIIIKGDWEQENIATMQIKQVKGIDVYGRPSSGRIKFHTSTEEQIKGLWAAWEKNDLLRQIKTYGGSFVPRFIRGSRTTLSNHAFGTAFDVNMEWNRLGSIPAQVGAEGSVRELVPIAHDFGFYWGGHFKSRPDGMHFEVAKKLSQRELDTALKKYELSI